MTQPQMLNVETEELLARANELEASIPPPPSDNPQAPCDLKMAVLAAQQLAKSADNMRTYLQVGVVREWRKLAESLRDAAKAYEDIDENTAAALNTGGNPGWETTPGRADDALDAVTLTPTPVVATGGPGDDYQDLKQRAWQLEQTDEGAAFDAFAEEWEAYRQRLLDAQHRFRPFLQWDGEATADVEQNFNSQRAWLASMAETCRTIASQARDVASAQRRALEERSGGTASWSWKYNDLVALDKQYATTTDAGIKSWVRQQYGRLQKLSDATIDGYRTRADLRAVDPPMPPRAYKFTPPAAPFDPGDIFQPAPGSGLPIDEQLPGMPSVPSVPSLGGPSTSDAALTDALTDATNASGQAPPLPTGAGSRGVKPASFGGGGVGGGVPSMPLAPSVDAGSMSQAAAARDLAGPGRATPGAAMGGPGSGMAPMGAPGAGQGQDRKNKRRQSDDKELYTEDRPWTEAVIGISPEQGQPRH
jgi:hypothetical protein